MEIILILNQKICCRFIDRPNKLVKTIFYNGPGQESSSKVDLLESNAFQSWLKNCLNDDIGTHANLRVLLSVQDYQNSLIYQKLDEIRKNYAEEHAVSIHSEIESQLGYLQLNHASASHEAFLFISILDGHATQTVIKKNADTSFQVVEKNDSIHKVNEACMLQCFFEEEEVDPAKNQSLKLALIEQQHDLNDLYALAEETDNHEITIAEFKEVFRDITKDLTIKTLVNQLENYFPYLKKHINKHKNAFCILSSDLFSLNVIGGTLSKSLGNREDISLFNTNPALLEELSFLEQGLLQHLNHKPVVANNKHIKNLRFYISNREASEQEWNIPVEDHEEDEANENWLTLNLDFPKINILYDMGQSVQFEKIMDWCPSTRADYKNKHGSYKLLKVSAFRDVSGSIYLQTKDTKATVSRTLIIA